MATREQVETLLAILTELNPDNQGVLSELCRTWLAVQDAPVGCVYTDGGDVITRLAGVGYYKGRRIRLVPMDPESP